MICHKCGEKFEEGLKKCPFCGTEVPNELDLELPELKNKEEVVEIEDTDTNLGDNYFEVELKEKEEDESFDQYDVDDLPEKEAKEAELDSSLEKTRSINPVKDTIEIKNLSLIDDINKQIDEMNGYAIPEEVSSKKTGEETSIKKEEPRLDTEESIKKRKQVLKFTGLGSLIVAILIIALIIFGSSNKNSIGNNYLVVLDSALTEYYETSKYDKIIEVLSAVKKEESKISEVQKKTKEYVDKWVKEYINSDIKTLGDFEDATKKYKSLIDELHANALITSNNGAIKALQDNDYDYIIKQLEQIYSDSSLYYVALDYYNQNDYNKAYTTFAKIEPTNTYYEKATAYKEMIFDNVFLLLEKDINKIEKELTDATDYKKLQVYSGVEEVLIQYNNLYSELELSKRSEYQILVNEYHNLVEEYTNKLGTENKNNFNHGENPPVVDETRNPDNN